MAESNAKKRVVVVGANRGIGLELARQFHERGDDVVATARRSSAALDAVGLTVHTDVDVTSQPSLKRLADALGPDSVDLLVVVAGILKRSALEGFDAEVVREQFEVNALGPLQTTATLLPCLREPSKVALLTSRMGSISDNTSGGSYGYRMSKAALNMAGASLALDLRSRDIAVVLLHPGYVQTEMTGNTGHIKADQSATGLIARIDALTRETSGSFVHQNGEALPW